MQNDSIQRLNVNIYGSNNDMVYNSVGRDNNTIDTLENTSQISTNAKEDNTNIYKSYAINIYRYKFADDFAVELYKFSKIHEYDNRKDFKEAWHIWIEEQDDMINDEIRRLTNLGYDGDIMDKMFKSARYYFRKKTTEKKTPQPRRVYQGVQKIFLDKMDENIKSNLSDKTYKPSSGFNTFCQENIDLLKEEINNLLKNGLTDATEIKNKIKKTYKNRYFLLVSK